jgi:hypothetical protein
MQPSSSSQVAVALALAVAVVATNVDSCGVVVIASLF